MTSRLIAVLGHALAAACLASLLESAAYAGTYDFVLDRRAVNITGRDSVALLINGQLPGPVLRFKEG
jgi:hypothetical protein